MLHATISWIQVTTTKLVGMTCVPHCLMTRCSVTVWKATPKAAFKREGRPGIGNYKHHSVVSCSQTKETSVTLELTSMKTIFDKILNRTLTLNALLSKSIFFVFLFCPELQCGHNLVYDSCGTACPSTCQEPTASSECVDSCTETCVCPEGLLLEGDRCIQPSECGCLLNDGRTYIPVSISTASREI